MSLKYAQKYKPRYVEVEGIKEIPVPNRIGNTFRWKPHLLGRADEESTLLRYKPLDGDQPCVEIDSNRFLGVQPYKSAVDNIDVTRYQVCGRFMYGY